jgi:hypothetical protein
MFSVTIPALDRLSERLTRKAAGMDVALRVTRRAERWKVRPDRARPGDTAFAHEGRNVLLLDQQVMAALASLQLDVRATGSGPRLRLRELASRDE